METQLLCTFTNREIYKNTITEIRENYRLVYNYIYVLQNKANLDELFVTYNVDTQIKVKPLKDTILVHRKKQSNTLYTINALNELVKELNNGILDKNFVINWDDYKNCIIVTNSEGTKKISTRVFEIIEF